MTSPFVGAGSSCGTAITFASAAASTSSHTFDVRKYTSPSTIVSSAGYASGPDASAIVGGSSATFASGALAIGSLGGDAGGSDFLHAMTTSIATTRFT